MLRESSYGSLEQRKLVGHEGVAVGEVLRIAKVRVLLAAIRKFKQGFEVVDLLTIGGSKQFGTDVVFAEQTLLDYQKLNRPKDQTVIAGLVVALENSAA